MPGEHKSRIAQGVAALAVLGALALGSRSMFVEPVQASPDHESGFVIAVNEARADKGLGALEVDEGLIDAARDWTKEMVEANALAHADDITLGVPPGWTKAGENVGRGESVAGLMAAFIDSPGHRRNLLDPDFNRIGVGSIVDDTGVLYTTHRFAQAQNRAVRWHHPRRCGRLPRRPAAPRRSGGERRHRPSEHRCVAWVSSRADSRDRRRFRSHVHRRQPTTGDDPPQAVPRRFVDRRRRDRTVVLTGSTGERWFSRSRRRRTGSASPADAAR